MIIEKEFYNQGAIEVAKGILGHYLVREVNGLKIRTKIVETESYIGSTDKACHAYNYKRTDRTKPLFEEGGIAYVYFIYGLYHCFNIVTNIKEEPEAVLIRAVEPLDNFEYLSNIRFNKNYNELTNAQKRNLTNGPSKLCSALSITREDNYKKLYIDSRLYLEYNYEKNIEIVETTRIGIDYAEEAKDFKWRFYIKNNPYVSKK
ncbi:MULTISPECIES: DNA-3-methyladenine glycosylase [Clostridium]|jgi:DNA-3-methyladenine glycosylase|uniref:DNA-3-methyladenine glycosylase n=1 Tax=Clostridium TaxID=1485 RepID=UPI00019AFD93|nr:MULTISPECIES: DNA-3-methyladenine glycosylase [Clostridium]EEH97493.1 DNA-3-methyladenine glycosylase [Clostridium sp. 7_2_43FAA]MBU6134992.1 DNA-3-methyladenine glycosylase [Clostridium tertium]MDB1941085.1 DNA-3-methyladenine glycosylase [Clostridium tertium]MDB1948699.1 DNA-3-methyladenine glycosylase [Clostridium tertium]MDI9216314.1 DNA-3-methyladenine glycosylase [Clostridium tertium]